MSQNPEAENHLNIELSEEMSEGQYINLALIAHSQTEFVIDFIRVMPNVPKAKVKSRIVMTPEHAVRLLAALRENIERFEDTYGIVKTSDGGGTGTLPSGFSFGGPAGQA